jgi:outer membrane protein OmpA-like peptidoglycan-associated protein
MGPDINSKGEDLFFNIPASSEFAYYSRSLEGDNTDIYRAKLPFYKSPEPYVTVRGKLIDAKTGKPIGAKIIYERLPDGKEIGVAHSNPETGEYEIRLPGGHLYGVRAEADGHISENQNLDLRDFKKDGVVTNKDITLAPIEVAQIEPNATITLNNIFFDFAKAVLKPESFPELNRIVDLMNQRPTLQVEIAGHADAMGPEDYNQLLSRFRADKVASYLIEKGIAKDRVTITFYGESKPVATNDTKEGRSKNRRVEFIILKM